MASTTTYGDFPGVKVTTSGGAITGIAVGREQKLVLIAPGDTATGSASVNEPTQISSRLDADRKFGDGSELAEAMKGALSNGANIDYLYGIALDALSVTGETETGSSKGTLTNAPIVEDESTITVTDTVDSNEVTVNYKYEADPGGPSDPDTININPITGAWTADSSSDYSFDYEYYDWTTALNSSTNVIEQEETGILGLSNESESIVTDVSGTVNTMRENYQMAMAVSAAQPTGTTSDGAPEYDTASYTDSIDNDSVFIHAPARKESSTSTITPALAGLMAGNDLNESIYNRALTTDDLDQRLSSSEADELRDEDVIPVRQPPSGGSILVSDNRSTSQSTDWERDYWKRRIVDQVVLIAKSIGDSVIGRINDEETQDTVETAIEVNLRGLAQDRLIEPNEGDEENWFVDVYEINSSTVGIDIGITPYGIVKRIETSIQISA